MKKNTAEQAHERLEGKAGEKKENIKCNEETFLTKTVYDRGNCTLSLRSNSLKHSQFSHLFVFTHILGSDASDIKPFDCEYSVRIGSALF